MFNELQSHHEAYSVFLTSDNRIEGILPPFTQSSERVKKLTELVKYSFDCDMVEIDQNSIRYFDSGHACEFTVIINGEHLEKDQRETVSFKQAWLY